MSTVLPWLEDSEAELAHRLNAGRLAHALLIQGPAGLGKLRLARTLVRMLLPDHALLEAGTHPDYFEVAVDEQEHSAILVDQIRALSEALLLSAGMGGARMGVIVEAHRMNRNAFNALLKTLEEPPDNAWLVLVTDQPNRLPATVRSRCQKVQVHSPAVEVGLAWLRSQLSDPSVSNEDLAMALSLSANAPLAALELLEGEGLAFGQAVRADLIALSEGGVVDDALLSRWLSAPEAVWRWLALWLANWARATGDSEQHRCSIPIRAEHIQHLWMQALEGRRLTETPVRQDLLLQRWVLSWQQACTKAR